jgi:hypothetical protein
LHRAGGWGTNIDCIIDDKLPATVLDDPDNHFRFESFLNVGDEEQAHVLAQPAGQEQFHLAFYGDDLRYHSSAFAVHTSQQWQQLDDMVARAEAYWHALPPARRDFDRDKGEFVRTFP